MKSKLLILLATVMLLGAGSVMGQMITLGSQSHGGLTSVLYGPWVPDLTEITFSINMNAGGAVRQGLTNGFRIYSPDGAEWTTMTADTTGTIGKAQFDLLWIMNFRSVTGTGSDTVGFAGSIMFGAGMAADFDDVTHTITIGPIDTVHREKTICLDSCYYPPSGTWKWAASTGDLFPGWGGPYCFTITKDDPNDVTSALGSALPTTWAMSQNYPNPFNPTTEIAFDVPTRSFVTVTVYNVLGQKINDLVNENLAAGSYTTTWDGRTSGGSEVSSGVYFYRIQSEGFTQTKKMMLLK
ncbi:MAG: T9SS type A sorting domain-containing protein [bacterium]